MDEKRADRALVAAFNELTELVREAKQAAWTVPHRPTHDALDALFGFLVGQAAAVADAEAAIDGRSPDMVSPSQHRSRNLIHDAHDQPDAIVPLLIERVHGVAGALRASAATIEGSDTARLLHETAEGLGRHIDALAATRDRGLE
jgi:hypothetical protein